MIEKLTFIHILTAALIVEIIMLYMFKFTKSSQAIKNWYKNLKWTAVLLDVLAIMIGIYIAKFIYEYLIKNNYIDSGNEFRNFLLLVLCVQIIHDFLFYFLVIKPYPKFKNTVMDEFKEYANYYRSQAIVADSMIYLFTVPLLYYFIMKQTDNVNIFISIVSIYLMGYFIHEK